MNYFEVKVNCCGQGRSGSGRSGGCGALRGLMGALVSWRQLSRRSLCTMLSRRSLFTKLCSSLFTKFSSSLFTKQHLGEATLICSTCRITGLIWELCNGGGIVADRHGGAGSCTDQEREVRRAQGGEGGCGWLIQWTGQCGHQRGRGVSSNCLLQVQLPSDFSYNATNHGFHTVQSRLRYFLPSQHF